MNFNPVSSPLKQILSSPREQSFEEALLQNAPNTVASLPASLLVTAGVVITKSIFSEAVINCNQDLKRKRVTDTFVPSPCWDLNEDALYNIVLQVNDDKNVQTLRSLSVVSKALDDLCKNVMIILSNSSKMNWRSGSFASFTEKKGKQILKIDFSLFSNSFIERISDKDCETILRQCPHLTDLCLVDNPLKDDLIQLVSPKIDLERITLSRLTAVSAEKIKNLVQNLPKLSFIKFVNCMMVDNPINILSELSRFKNIKRIEMHGVDFTKGVDLVKGKENVDPLKLIPDDSVSKRERHQERVALHLDRFTFPEGTKKVLESKYTLTLGAPASSRRPTSMKLQSVAKKLF